MNILDRRGRYSTSNQPHASQRYFSAKKRIAWILSAALIYMIPLSGCAGNQLTPEENQRYEKLGLELSEIQAERAQMEREVTQAFQKSGKLERSNGLKGKLTFGCGYRVGGQALGPLPFKKKKGKNAKFGQGKPSKRASCKSHTLRVK